MRCPSTENCNSWLRDAYEARLRAERRVKFYHALRRTVAWALFYALCGIAAGVLLMAALYLCP